MTRPLHLALVPLASLLGGCGFLGTGDSPFQVAYRAGAGYWPENSRIAVDNALAMLYDGIHVDVVVAADEIPVLHRTASLAPEVCVAASGAAVSEGEVVIADYSFEELEDGWRCGGIANPDYEEAATAQDGIAPMTYLMEGLVNRGAGNLVVINVIYQEGLTLDAETTARAVLDTWFAYDPGNRVIFATDQPGMIEAIDAHAALISRQDQVSTTLIWPDDPGFGSGIAADLSQTLGLADPVAQASAAGADGVLMSAHMIDRQMVRKLGGAGFEVQVWQTDGDSRESAFSRWPLDAFLTAYPDPEANQ